MKTVKRLALLSTILMLAFSLHGIAQKMQAVSQKPNVIVIYTDDQDFEETGCYGGRVSTPNINSLAEDGIKFTHYYPSSPVCTPSRYSALTGQYASRSKALQKNYPNTEPPLIRWNTGISEGEVAVTGLLKANGYVTGYVGKWHNWSVNEYELFRHVPYLSDPESPPMKNLIEKNYEVICDHIRRTTGFDYVSSIYGTNFQWLPIPTKLMYHNQHWITHGAIEFIEQNKENPFFLYMATTLPHGPPAIESLKADPRATSAGYKTEHLNVQPLYQNILNRAKKAGLTEEDLKDEGSWVDMAWLDDGIGAVLKKLEKLGLVENTLIIFASDHQSFGKMTCYRGRAPFLMQWKGTLKGGQVNDKLVSNIDIIPTILDACGITPQESLNLDGRSLLPLFSQEETHWRESLYLEVTYTRGVVTKDWKYIALRYPQKIQNEINASNRREFNQEGTRLSEGASKKTRVRYDSDKKFPGYYDYDQLYDINTDPNEQNNLVKNVKYEHILSDMKRRLKKYSQDLPHRFGEFKE